MFRNILFLVAMVLWGNVAFADDTPPEAVFDCQLTLFRNGIPYKISHHQFEIPNQANMGFAYTEKMKSADLVSFYDIMFKEKVREKYVGGVFVYISRPSETFGAEIDVSAVESAKEIPRRIGGSAAGRPDQWHSMDDIWLSADIETPPGFSDANVDFECDSKKTATRSK